MCVLFDGHLFHMWYTAWNQAGEFRIGYARSPDGLTWSKDTAGNPVLSPGPPGVWDDVLVALPVVRLEATDYVMWYAGTEGTRFQTGRAVSHDAPSGIGGGPAAYGLRLEHNHPNPFNPQTTISYELLRPETVSIRIYDIAGRLVRNLVDGDAASAGRHDVSWDGRDESGQGVASGVYYYRLEVGSLSRTARMTLVK
jgi:hypothetical protein